jgi:hypothetical protein
MEDIPDLTRILRMLARLAVPPIQGYRADSAATNWQRGGFAENATDG